MRAKVLELERQTNETDLALITSKYTISKLEQEKTELKTQNEWLEEQLQLKINEISDFRKFSNNENVELKHQILKFKSENENLSVENQVILIVEFFLLFFFFFFLSFFFPSFLFSLSFFSLFSLFSLSFFFLSFFFSFFFSFSSLSFFSLSFFSLSFFLSSL
jgi:cellulose synthase/poly-beta-1,6-N-acetylglucosamine synthase-like glycosyltransferase